MSRKYKAVLALAGRAKKARVWVFVLLSTTILLLIYALAVTLALPGFGPIEVIRESYRVAGTGETTDTYFTVERLPGKTFWDWMALILPVEIPLVVYLLNRAQRRRELDGEAEHVQRSALQSYFDQIKEMLLKDGLRSSKGNEDVHTLAQTRTSLTLDGLDPNRKRTLLWFLYDLNLIKKEDPVISLNNASLKDAYLADSFLASANLKGADLSGANLSGTDLSAADLSAADLSGANLSSADLSSANLSGAILRNANLSEANVTKANLTEAESLTQKQLEQAIGNENTKLPEGLHPAASWAQGEHGATGGEGIATTQRI